MTTKEKLLFASPLVILAVPLLFRARNGKGAFRQVLVQLAGANAIDCNAISQSGCPDSTLKTGKPFFSSSRLYGLSDAVPYWSGLVRTPEGRVFSLGWSESPWYSFSPGKLLWIARIKNSELLSKNYTLNSTNALTEAERQQLLQEAANR